MSKETKIKIDDLLDMGKFPEIISGVIQCGSQRNETEGLREIQEAYEQIRRISQDVQNKSKVYNDRIQEQVSEVIGQEQNELKQIRQCLTRVLDNDVLEERYFLYLNEQLEKDIKVVKGFNGPNPAILKTKNYPQKLEEIKQNIDNEIQKLSKLSKMVAEDIEQEEIITKHLDKLKHENQALHDKINNNVKNKIKAEIKELTNNKHYQEVAGNTDEAIIQKMQKTVIIIDEIVRMFISEDFNNLNQKQTELDSSLNNLKSINTTIIRDYKWHIIRGLRNVLNRRIPQIIDELNREEQQSQ